MPLLVPFAGVCVCVCVCVDNTYHFVDVPLFHYTACVACSTTCSVSTHQVSLSLAVSIDSFYEVQDTFTSNLAFVLGIPPWRITVVDVVPGSVNVDFEIAPSPILVFEQSSYVAVEGSVATNISIIRSSNIYGWGVWTCCTNAPYTIHHTPYTIHHTPQRDKNTCSSLPRTSSFPLFIITHSGYHTASKPWAKCLIDLLWGLFVVVAVMLYIYIYQPIIHNDASRKCILLSLSSYASIWTPTSHIATILCTRLTQSRQFGPVFESF